MTTQIVTADIGGTHARFAIAEITDGCVQSLGPEIVLRAADYPGVGAAWTAFAAAIGRPLPSAAAFAVAAPITPGLLRFTNSPWIIDPGTLAADLGLDTATIINDFAAVAYAVSALPQAAFRQLCGPDIALPRLGNISIIGPGTGLGIAQLLRTTNGDHVIATEGAHIGFAPVDAFDDALLARLRHRHGRVSVERLVSGPGLRNFLDPEIPFAGDDKALWSAAFAGTDAAAGFALARFAMTLGSFVGDAALMHYPVGIVIAGGLGLRLADYLPTSGFAARLVAKGRYETRLAALPVKLLTHPQPGLYGAAAAFAKDHP
ncbi:MAG: glucokinase [Sandarakinorhabdus sp.]|nr:glucokinase [Sandarakinorhabdus sp.]